MVYIDGIFLASAPQRVPERYKSPENLFRDSGKRIAANKLIRIFAKNLLLYKWVME